MNTALTNRTTLMLIGLFVISVQVAGGLYAAHEIETPYAIELFHSAGLLWLGGLWLRADARIKRFHWPYCQGIFLWVAWVIIVPYYFWQTRGAKGLLILMGLVVTYLLTNLIGVAVYLLLV